MQFRVDLGSVSQRRIKAEVAVDLDASAPRTIEFMLPVWTPGSYLIREYARHVRRIVAVDGVSGIALALGKSTKNRYRVTIPSECTRVVLRYEVYANALTVREAAVGPDFAFWNGACVYLWPVGHEHRPARIAVELPAGWQLHCGARLEGDAAFRVSGLDEAVDTPCLAAPSPSGFEFDAVGLRVRFVAVGLGAFELPGTLRDDVLRVVETTAALFDGEIPISDYVFLALFAAQGRGGLEHAKSCALLAPRTTFAPRRSYEEFLSLVAHEFLHVWNGKALRPLELQMYDYERENLTRLLWVVEGFTAYYDDHLCLRAGILDARAYLRVICGHAEAMVRAPGRLEHPLAEASFDAWLRFYRPDENTRNTTQNYYSNGALLAIWVDSRVRDHSDGARSLDDVMRSLWSRTRERGYCFEDVAGAIAEAAGRDLTAELRALVEGPFDPDLTRALAVYGLDARWLADDDPTVGVQFRTGELRVANVIDGSPAWEAGLAPDDEIVAAAGLRVTHENWNDVFPQLARGGHAVALLVSRRGRMETIEVAPDTHRFGRLEITAAADADARALRLRSGWLGPSSTKL